jgi:hypothetical protein
MKQSDKQGLETENQVIDRIGQLLERYQNRMTFDNVRVAERYAKFQVHILIHFRFDGKEQVASFSCCPEFRGGKTEERPNPIVILKKRFGRIKLEARNANIGYEQGTVFISDVEFINDPEGITLPSLIRFGSPNSMYSIIRHALYFSHVFGLVFIGALGNGVVDMPTRTRAQRRIQPQLKGQMIQRGPEIVNHVSHNQRNLVRRDLEIPSRMKLLLASLCVDLGRESIGLSVKKGIISNFEIADVLFGPFDLLSNEGDFFIGG